MEGFEAQAEEQWSKKQEPKAQTNSGNKPRTILKHAEKLALISMSEADKTLTQEQVSIVSSVSRERERKKAPKSWGKKPEQESLSRGNPARGSGERLDARGEMRR
jgi:hypothetical protein